MFEYAELKTVVDAIANIAKVDAKVLAAGGFAELSPCATDRVSDGLFGKEIHKVRFTCNTLDYFKVQYEMVVDAPLTETIRFQVLEAQKFLRKAKIKTGERVLILPGLKGGNEATFAFGVGGEARVATQLSTLAQGDALPNVVHLGEVSEKAQLKTALFQKYLRKALVCASDDDSRQNLARVCVFAEEGRINMVTTDGHRLYGVAYNGITTGTMESVSLANPILIPQRIANILLDNLDKKSDFTISLRAIPTNNTDPTVIFYEIAQNGFTLTVAEYHNLRFPDFRPVLPHEDSYKNQFRVPCADMIEACDLALAFELSKAASFTLHVKPGGTNLICYSPKIEQQIAVEALLPSVIGAKFAVSPLYLKESVNLLVPDGVKQKGSFEMHFVDAFSPVKILNSNPDPEVYTEIGIVMPCRL